MPRFIHENVVMGRILPAIVPLLIATMPACAAPEEMGTEVGEGYRLRATAALP